MPTLRALTGTLVTSRPPMVIVPSDGVSKPASMRSVVVLPQPEGPSRVTSVPSSMVRFSLSTAVAPAAPGKRLVILEKTTFDMGLTSSMPN